MLEYGQRLARRQRNVAAAPGAGEPSSAERLFDRAARRRRRRGRRAALGAASPARAPMRWWSMPATPRCSACRPSTPLDALVFSGPGAPWRDVMVAGRWVIRGGVHPRAEAIAARFAAAMHALG